MKRSSASEIQTGLHEGNSTRGPDSPAGPNLSLRLTRLPRYPSKLDPPLRLVRLSVRSLLAAHREVYLSIIGETHGLLISTRWIDGLYARVYNVEMIYTHVLNKPGIGVRSPLDG